MTKEFKPNIIPARDMLLVTILDGRPPTSDLILLDDSKMFPVFHVLAVGPDVKHTMVGDRVIGLSSNIIPFDQHTQTIFFPECAILGYFVPPSVLS